MWAADWGNLLHVNPQLLSLLFIQEVSFSFGDGARGSFNISLTFEFWRWIQEDQVSEQSSPLSISGSIQGSILGSTQGSRLDSVKDKRSLLCTFIITMICFADRCSGMSSECILAIKIIMNPDTHAEPTAHHRSKSALQYSALQISVHFCMHWVVSVKIKNCTCTLLNWLNETLKFL